MRSHGKASALYARADAKVDIIPFGDKTLAEAIQEVLGRNKPLLQMELTIKLMEAGFYTTRNKKDFRHSVGGELRAHPELFSYDDGKWSLVG